MAPDRRATVLHLTERAAWEAGRERGAYEPAGYTTEGFVHCSTPAQVVGVANRFYRGSADVVLLEIDPALTGVELRWDPAADRGGERFPHLYGPIVASAVVAVHDFPEGPDGWDVLPASLTPR